jgi:hypothetical protein
MVMLNQEIQDQLHHLDQRFHAQAVVVAVLVIINLVPLVVVQYL